MSHQHCLVNLGLSEPAGLLSGEEDFDGHLLSPPAAQPHFAIAPFADLTHHLDLLGDGSLHLQEGRTCLLRAIVIHQSWNRSGAVLHSHQQREPGATARALRLVNQVFKGLSHRNEDFLLQVLVVPLAFALPLIPDTQRNLLDAGAAS